MQAGQQSPSSNAKQYLRALQAAPNLSLLLRKRSLHLSLSLSSQCVPVPICALSAFLGTQNEPAGTIHI